MLQGRENQTGDGDVIIVGQIQVVAFVELLDGQVAGHAEMPLRRRLHVLAGVVVLVKYLPDNLLDEVLEGNQPESTAVFVNHDGHVCVALLQGAHQFVHARRGGNEERLAHDGVEAEGAVVAGQGQEILGEHDAHDVVERVVVDRQARVATAAHDLDHLLQRPRALHGPDVGARRHGLPHAGVRQVEDAGDHAGVGLLHQAVLAAFRKQQQQFLGRVHALRTAWRAHREESQEDAGALVQEPDGWPEGVHEHRQRARHPAADLLRMQQRQGFGGELAQDDEQKGDAGEGRRTRHRVRRQTGERSGQGMKDVHQQGGKGCLADPAQRQGGEGDT